MICKLWGWVFRRWLEDVYRPGQYGTVIRVKGWRTALVQMPNGDRVTITPCFWGLE